MNKSFSPKSTNSTTSNDTKHSNNVSKLRRLKIEENLLLQSIQKLDQKWNYEGTEFDISKKGETMSKKLKDSYTNIKNLFDEVKTVTSSQELLAELDIDEIKQKVLELETTMKSFKLFLDIELSSLKTAEQEITIQVEKMNLEDTKMIKRPVKIPSAKYNKVVPSPVRLLMTSSFKCIEVQEFQVFMKNSPNRFGGWNEYHHNIFVKYWQKHFGKSASTDFEDSVVEKLTHENFVEEALFKLQGIDKENLISHMEWYKKYIFLKGKQQIAIDKWKSSRRTLRKIPEKVMIKSSEQARDLTSGSDDVDILDFSQTACDFIDLTKEYNRLEAVNNRKTCPKMKSKLLKQTTPIRKLKQDDIERLMRPTKQWVSRSYDDAQKIQQMNFIENLEKLRVPSWRQYL